MLLLGSFWKQCAKHHLQDLLLALSGKHRRPVFENVHGDRHGSTSDPAGLSATRAPRSSALSAHPELVAF